jgi:hypothetical protein
MAACKSMPATRNTSFLFLPLRVGWPGRVSCSIIRIRFVLCSLLLLNSMVPSTAAQDQDGAKYSFERVKVPGAAFQSRDLGRLSLSQNPPQ